MDIRKAVITAAGERQRHLPLQTVVDSRGHNRKVLDLLIDEATSAGIEEVGVVIRPGTEDLYSGAVEGLSAKVTFIEQQQPRGYGHAIISASDFINDEPFLLMVCDHVYVSDAPEGQTCAQQLIEMAKKEECVISAVQPTHEGRITNFGAVGGRLYDRDNDLYEVTAVLEKPTPTDAEQFIMTPGIRHGYYLGFFGMHVIQPLVLDILKQREAELSPNDTIDLSSALHEAAQRGRYLAQVMRGRRYDLDCRHGLLIGQLAVSLAGEYRDEVLSSLTDLLARGIMRSPMNHPST